MPTPTAERINPFNVITFAPGISGRSPQVQATETLAQFPEGTTQVYAVIQVARDFPGARWHGEWLVNGKPHADWVVKGWDIEPGFAWTRVWQANGLDAGEYELRLMADNQVVQKNSFVLFKRASNTSGFSTIRFAEGNQDDKPVNVHRPIDFFQADTKKVWAFFDAVNLPKGTAWKWEWYRDHERLAQVGGIKTWDAAPNEKNWWLSLYDHEKLDTGTYTLKLFIGDTLAQIGTFVVE